MFAALKVRSLGARLVGGQIDRIEEGLRAEGCQVVDTFEEADFTFVNDAPHYQEAIDAKLSGELRGKLILNVLDLAKHLGAAFPLARVQQQLAHADAVSTISSTVGEDIKARLRIDAHVIYNPIRAVSYARLPCQYRAMFVGRVQDGEKRSMLGASALAILGFTYDEWVTVGREAPPYGGIYAGEVTDKVLSRLYNSVDFLMCPTRNAFLGLPILEAMACGTIPVVCSDLDIKAEFLPSSVFPEYDSVTPDAPSIARFVSRFMQDNDAKAEFSARVHAHYAAHWADKLSPRGVAQAILRVYQGLRDTDDGWPEGDGMCV